MKRCHSEMFKNIPCGNTHPFALQKFDIRKNLAKRGILKARPAKPWTQAFSVLKLDPTEGS